MPNEETGIVAGNINADLAAPDWMKEQAVAGVDNLRAYQTRPRLSIVQSQSSHERKDTFGEGATALFPDGISVAEPMQPWTGIPIAFWPTWETWSDINDSANPMVEDVTMDPQSAVAVRSRSRTTRVEVYGNDREFKRKFVEVMNFIFIIDDGPAKGELCIVSFSSGELFTGKKLNKLIARRADKYNASIFDNRVTLTPALRQRNNREWFGFDFSNPIEGGALVTERERHDQLAAMHAEAMETIAAGAIRVARDEDEGGDTPSDDNDLPI